MSKALIAGITQVATEKGLDREVIFEAIEAALISAYKRNYGSIANVTSEVDRVSGDMRVYAEREVVEDVMNQRTEISLEEVRSLYPTAKIGDVVQVQSKPANFGRIAAQTAKQVILQRIREAERDTVFENFAHRVGEVINAQVRSTDNVSGAITVMLDEKHEALLLRDEQIPTEKPRRGEYLRVYVVDVHKSTRGPVIKLSRTHRNLLRRLMEQEIPEVRDGIVEIKAIAREPGARSKSAVVATVPGVDPVGSCVGMRGLRIQNIVNELSGEKIDVVEWSSDVPTYISNALSPAKVNSVILDEAGSIKTAIVVVPDRQLSLAIGKEGQNARLAAKLTGWRIDIKSESEAAKEGLDRLAIETGRTTRHTDLFSVAERFLQEEGEGEDRLSKAARALEELNVEEGLPAGLPPLEMPSLPQEGRETYRDLWPLTEDLAPEVRSLGEELEPAVSDERELQQSSESTPDTDDEKIGSVTRIDQLPQVITADMLRARMNKGKSIDLGADFEIPPELLVGLDEEAEEWDDDVDSKKKGAAAKGKVSKKVEKVKKGKAPEAKPSKGKKWRPPSDDEDFGARY
jgi:transcription termination/antitermination protein NusA